MNIELSFSELMQRYDEPECQMLIQAIAIISVQDAFCNMTPDEVFDYVKAQAESILADMEPATWVITRRIMLRHILCRGGYTNTAQNE